MSSAEENTSDLGDHYAHLKVGDDDDEDEAEFKPSDDDDETASDECDDKADDTKYAVLSGKLSLNDEGRIVYSGTWTMKTCAGGTKGPKFKLKSKKMFSPPGNGSDGKSTFDVCRPVGHGSAGKRTLLFDGFFFTIEDKNGSSSRKIKERDVEIIFALRQDKAHANGNGESIDVKAENNEADKTNCFDVKGRGVNEFGAFTVCGSYNIEQSQIDRNMKHGIPLICEKQYAGDCSISGNHTKRLKCGVSEEDDDMISDADEEDGADWEELAALHEEADMSLEELRKRYQGTKDKEFDGGNMEDNDYRPTKKSRKDNDSDDEYGF